jgi:hypothetical protein
VSPSKEAVTPKDGLFLFTREKGVNVKRPRMSGPWCFLCLSPERMASLKALAAERDMPYCGAEFASNSVPLPAPTYPPSIQSEQFYIDSE